MKSPLFKTEYCNMPLSIPVPWKVFFEQHAQILGVSRNSAICLALKLGGPVLERYVSSLKASLRKICSQVEPETSEILAPSAPCGPCAIKRTYGNARRKARIIRATKPQSR
jgi:hypothetical protein